MMKRIFMYLVLALPLCLLLISRAPASDDGDTLLGAAMDGWPYSTMKVSEADPIPRLTIPIVPPRPSVPDPDSQPVSPDDQTPGVPKYECPKTRYINCMPPVQEIDKPMCTKEYLEWAKSHCTGFEVVY
jgi:hypothetical protein